MSDDLNAQILAALRARAGGILRPPTLDPNSAPPIPSVGRLPTGGGGLAPSTLAPMPEMGGQGIPIPQPPTPVQGPTGIKRVLLTLGQWAGGEGPLGQLAGNALDPNKVAMTNYERQLKDADTASQIADRNRLANKPDPADKLGEEEQGFQEALKSNPDLTRLAYHDQWEAAGKSPANREPVHFPPGEMVADPTAPGGYRQVGEPKPSAEKTPELKTIQVGDKVHYAKEGPDGSLTDTGVEAPKTFADTGLFDPVTDANGQTVKFDKRSGNTSPISGNTAPVLSTQQSGELKTAEETGREADKRLRTMTDLQDQALKGNQQAMLGLLTNHIGMTLGAQKGARITQSILSEAQQSAPWLQRVSASFDKDGYLSGVKLTPDQITQMVNMGHTVREKQWQETYDTMKQFGATDFSKVIPGDVLSKFQALEKGSGGGGSGSSTGGLKITRDASGRITGVE